MSVASSAASCISVTFDGRVMTLEEALDDNFRQIQRMLTNLNMEMRRLAAKTEQEIDEVEDFRESVLFEDVSFDLVTGMVRLLEEIPPMARMITGNAPAECKEWYRLHKEQRKIKLTQEKAEHKVRTDKAKLELKAVLKGESTGNATHGGLPTVSESKTG
jgi:hypothetical protein